jgi:ERCC4-type nuclease
VYILEGSLDIPFATLEKPALLKHLTRLSLRYHIPFFRTANIKETAELLLLLEAQWKDDPTTFQKPQELSYVETRGKSRTENSDDPKVFAASVLMCCRGVSPQIANALLAGCGGTLTDVWEASVETLASIVVGKQKFGKVKAERLHSLLHPVRETTTAFVAGSADQIKM